MIPLTTLLDDAKCYEVLRGLRWPEGVLCPQCGSSHVSQQGRDTTQPARRKYRCGDCGRHFDDLTGTIFAGRHQPLAAWIGCLYLMGLNRSNRQIAQELGLNEDDAQRMTEQLRTGIVASEPTPRLSGEVECDEVYVVAGHKGHPEAVKKKGARGAAAG
jgi:transposase-like protein